MTPLSVDTAQQFSLGISNLQLFFRGWGIIVLVMLFLWWLQRRSKNATLVDVGWSAALGFLAIYYATNGSGFLPRRSILWLMAGIWSIRLTLYLLFNRVIGKPHYAEDPRYRALRNKWGATAQFKFFFFYQGQGILAAVLSLPFLFACYDPKASLTWLEYAAMLLWAIGVVGETLADYQLSRFKSSTDAAGKTCRVGLWRYSRHPNYFFEWIVWCAFGIYALDGSYGWIGMLSPIIMLYLIVKVTGIPPTEARAMQHRGADYSDYQKTTSMFIPWFPRR